MNTTIGTIAAIFISAAVAIAQEPPREASAIFKVLITATANQDYKAFQQPGDAAFQAGITEDMFKKVCLQLGPLLKGGYDSTFLTTMTQQGFAVYLWKITPRIGNDQFVAKLVLKNGKAAGFWIQ